MAQIQLAKFGVPYLDDVASASASAANSRGLLKHPLILALAFKHRGIGARDVAHKLEAQ